MKINISFILGLVFIIMVKGDKAEEDQKEENKYSVGIEKIKLLKLKRDNFYSHYNFAQKQWTEWDWKGATTM